MTRRALCAYVFATAFAYLDGRMGWRGGRAGNWGVNGLIIADFKDGEGLERLRSALAFREVGSRSGGCGGNC